MAKADTLKYEELVIEVEFVADSGTYTKICGMRGATVNRTMSVDSDEVPDCDDESLPFGVEKSARSIEVSISGTGVWAQTSHKSMMDWFYEAQELRVQVRNSKVEADGASGDPIIEGGKALLTSLTNDKQKGPKVTADIEIEFITTPTVTDKA